MVSKKFCDSCGSVILGLSTQVLIKLNREEILCQDTCDSCIDRVKQVLNVGRDN